MQVFTSAADIHAAKGSELGTSDWVTVDQERINKFADATDDHQWIHVDPDRAKDGPFGATIAHGYLTLSLLPMLVSQVYKIENAKMAINYGLNKVRFTNPVVVGSRIRSRTELVDVADAGEGVQMTMKTTVEIEGNDRPACVVEHLGRLFF